MSKSKNSLTKTRGTSGNSTKLGEVEEESTSAADNEIEDSRKSYVPADANENELRGSTPRLSIRQTRRSEKHAIRTKRSLEKSESKGCCNGGSICVTF